MSERLQDGRAAEAISQRVAEVPMLPVVVSQLLTLIGRENHSIQEVLRVVEYDVILTARVLKIANSAAYARGQTITTLSRALLQLGEKMVVGIALSSCSPQIYNHALEGYESAAGELWDHSLCTAIATREIVRYALAPVSADVAFTAGLLHDVGKAVISEFLKGNAEILSHRCDTGQVQDFLSAERELVGTDHAEVGYAVAQRWGLPDPLGVIIRDHHHPSTSDTEALALLYAVHLGDLIAMMVGVGTGADTLAYQADPGYQHYLKITRENFDRVFLQVQEEYHRTKAAIFSPAEARS